MAAAELRMLQHAIGFNLLSNKRLDNIKTKKASIDKWVSKLESNENGGSSWGSRVRRGEAIATLPAEFLAESEPVRLEVLYRINYRGYLERELRQIEKLRHVERIHIPTDIDYMSIRGLRRESAIKLHQIRPFTLGQASRISGVNPADISILMVVIQAGRAVPRDEQPRTSADLLMRRHESPDCRRCNKWVTLGNSLANQHCQSILRRMSEQKPKKILIVDDEPDVADLVSYHLKAKGYQVETVNDPNVSLGIARSFLPDLVILDIMMPDLNGIQICRILRADPRLQTCPNYLSDRQGRRGDRIAGFETGCDDYICKPLALRN